MSRSDAIPSPDRSERSGLSLRLRLMLMLLAVFGVIQVSMSVVHLLYVRRTASEVFNERMAGAAEQIENRLETASPPLTNSLVGDIAAREGRGMLSHFVAVSLYDPQGRLVASNVQPGLPLDAVGGSQAALSAGGPVMAQATVEAFAAQANGTTRGRIIARPIGTIDGNRYLLLVAAPETFVSYFSDRVSMHIVLLTPAGLLVAAVAGWLIAGVAVRPLQRLSQIASQLRPDNLAQPIKIGSSASELTSLQQELEHMRRRLNNGYQAQERFVANVSHEIKTPIATVLTEAQTLGRTEGAPPNVRRFIESTQDEMRRLGKLVESFLLLTRVRHGKPLETTARTVPVNDIVLDSVQHCSKMADQYGVRLYPELAAEEDLDFTVHGDPELLRTLVDNLIRNAIRFSPRDARVEVLVRADGSTKVCICVRDRGPGIPESLLDTLFDRFAQDKREEKLGRGSGLGLEIAQGIAELHGGRITVTNLEPVGCEFCATLPLQDSLEPASTDEADFMTPSQPVQRVGQ